MELHILYLYLIKNNDDYELGSYLIMFGMLIIIFFLNRRNRCKRK
jgi:hypothetical protein